MTLSKWEIPKNHNCGLIYSEFIKTAPQLSFILCGNCAHLFPLSAQVYAGESLPALLASLSPAGPRRPSRRTQFIARGERSP